MLSLDWNVETILGLSKWERLRKGKEKRKVGEEKAFHSGRIGGNEGELLSGINMVCCLSYWIELRGMKKHLDRLDEG